jgi:hypothetical protein
MPIIRHNRPVVQRLGNDIVYGTGVDGNATISGTTILDRDMYYKDCTVNSGAILFTNGFRVFCTGTLSIAGTLGMPSSATHTVGLGTITGRVADGATGGTKTYVLGDSDAGGAAQVPASILKDLEHAIQGWNWDPTDGFKRFEGGSDGDVGSDTAGSPGNPGGAPPGNPPLGNPGNVGSQGATGSGGAGGTGGGLVVVAAKTISGSGTIASVGASGTAGSTGSTGADGNPGNAGAVNPDSHNPSGSGTNAPTPNDPVAGNFNADHYSAGNADHYFAGNADHNTADHHTPPTHKESAGTPVTAPAHNPGYHIPTSDQHHQGYEYHNENPGNPVWTPVPGSHTEGNHSEGDASSHSEGDASSHSEGTQNSPTPVADTPGNPYSHAAHHSEGNQDPGGAAGTGGTGGTGATGDTGQLGGIILITDTASSTIQSAMTLTSATYTHINGSV